jgi:beta-RFAP synthase
MTDLRLRIRTPSRLHFGLLGWGPQPLRRFGGIGLMIDSPGIELSVEPAPAWNFEGPLATRVEQIVTQLRARMHENGTTLPPARIRVERAPAEHVGLGVGTQLCLAVARTVLRLAGTAEPAVEQLARLTGRGRRSGIGLHGFHHGGLIVDGQRTAQDEIPPLLARLPFPEEWSILIIQPPGDRGLHGSDERRAFANLAPIAQSVADSLGQLVVREILPAVARADLSTFGGALGELQAQVGACFAPAQGGIYTTAQAAAIVDDLQQAGFAGAGQSSWGPTLYAFGHRSDHDLATSAERRLVQRFGLDESSVFRARADNQGARLVADG